MSGVSGPTSRWPLARSVQSLLSQFAEQLHVHMPPDSVRMEMESTPSLYVGDLVGVAVGPGVGVGVGGSVGALVGAGVPIT
jgi:hypothetical protein